MSENYVAPCEQGERCILKTQGYVTFENPRNGPPVGVVKECRGPRKVEFSRSQGRCLYCEKYGNPPPDLVPYQ